jgi:hypothetical protein
LFGSETLTLREEHELRTIENRVLKRIFGPKREEVTGGWRKVTNEERHSMFSSNVITVILSRSMRWMMHVQMYG